MLQAQINCGKDSSLTISLEDPHYHSCPPAKLFSYKLKNNSVSEARRSAWNSLSSFAHKMKMEPYDLFRMEIIQVLNSAGLQMNETTLNNVEIELYGADFSAKFERK